MKKLFLLTVIALFGLSTMVTFGQGENYPKKDKQVFFPKHVHSHDIFEALKAFEIGNYTIITQKQWDHLWWYGAEIRRAENHTWGETIEKQDFWITEDRDRSYPKDKEFETFEFVENNITTGFETTILLVNGSVLMYKKGPWTFANGAGEGNGWWKSAKNTNKTRTGLR